MKTLRSRKRCVNVNLWHAGKCDMLNYTLRHGYCATVILFLSAVTFEVVNDSATKTIHTVVHCRSSQCDVIWNTISANLLAHIKATIKIHKELGLSSESFFFFLQLVDNWWTTDSSVFPSGLISCAKWWGIKIWPQEEAFQVDCVWGWWRLRQDLNNFLLFRNMAFLIFHSAHRVWSTASTSAGEM